MLKKCFAYCQYILPQHFLTALVGSIASSQKPWLKNMLIKHFISHYGVNMSEAKISDPLQYDSFKSFFIRELKENLRPVAKDPNIIVAPCDGILAEKGHIDKNKLLQAKGFYFDLESLLANDLQLAARFEDGDYATFYLAPHNYHRVHMPLDGILKKIIFVPGQLFSVNKITSQVVPKLYSRNERLILIFETKIGTVSVILVGALFVGSIQTPWFTSKGKEITHVTQNIALKKAEEIGYFNLGSTVILLFEKNKIAWEQIENQQAINYGQAIARF